MGSSGLVGNWPSFDPHNFSQLRPTDPTFKKTPITYHPTHGRTQPPPDQVISSEAKNILLRQFYHRSDEKKKTPITYHPTHGRTQPPPDQVISSEAKNILLRQFYHRSDEKLRPKRASPENLAPKQECKHPRDSGPSSSSEPPPRDF